MISDDCTNPVYRKASCKFCRRELDIKIDPACPRAEAEFWLTIAACNRCADYRTGLHTIIAAIANVCRTLTRIRDGESSSRQRVEDRCKTVLVELTRKYANHVCDFYNKTTVWEPDFPQMLFEQPAKVDIALLAYRQGIPRC